MSMLTKEEYGIHKKNSIVNQIRAISWNLC